MLGRGISSYSSGSSDDSSLRMRLSSRSDSASIAISRLHTPMAMLHLDKTSNQPKVNSCNILYTNMLNPLQSAPLQNIFTNRY